MGGEIESQFTAPLVAALAFLKSAWLILAQPTAFCRAWLNGPQGMAELSFPLTRWWKRIARRPQVIARPFRALILGLGLIAAVGALEEGAWRVAGLGELQKEIARRQEEAVQQTSRYYYGHDVRIVKIGELTGFHPLDAALLESWHLVSYLAFAVFIAALTPKRNLVHPRAVFQYFAYAVGVGLLLQVAARAVGAGLFIPIAGASLEAALHVANIIVLFFGFLPMVWLGAILPIVVFPRVIPVSRLRVTGAVVGGLALMGAINVILTQIMLHLGIVLT